MSNPFWKSNSKIDYKKIYLYILCTEDDHWVIETSVKGEILVLWCLGELRFI